jgi:L-amino acid N-acyltransferase YncA
VSGTDARVRALAASDWAAVRAVYEEGLATGQATFQTETPSWELWDASHLSVARLVACLPDGPAERVIGWAALSPMSRRHCYRGVAEVSVYIASDARGRGVGRALMDSLVHASEAAGIWTLWSSIFPENAASIRLHESVGFRILGRRERIAQLHGVWRDTVIMERRSDVVGARDHESP